MTHKRNRCNNALTYNQGYRSRRLRAGWVAMIQGPACIKERAIAPMHADCVREGSRAYWCTWKERAGGERESVYTKKRLQGGSGT